MFKYNLFKYARLVGSFFIDGTQFGVNEAAISVTSLMNGPSLRRLLTKSVFKRYNQNFLTADSPQGTFINSKPFIFCVLIPVNKLTVSFYLMLSRFIGFIGQSLEVLHESSKRIEWCNSHILLSALTIQREVLIPSQTLSNKNREPKYARSQPKLSVAFITDPLR